MRTFCPSSRFENEKCKLGSFSKALIIDDNNNTRVAISSHLKRLGFTDIYSETDGRKGFELYEELC